MWNLLGLVDLLDLLGLNTLFVDIVSSARPDCQIELSDCQTAGLPFLDLLDFLHQNSG